MSNQTQAIQISLWNEKVSLEEAFSFLQRAPVAEELVLRELAKRILLERSFSDYQVTLSPQEEQALWEKFCQDMQLDSNEKQTAFFQRSNIDRTDFQRKLSYQEKLTRLRLAVVTDENVKQLFTQRKLQFDQILFSLIRVEKAEQAQELYRQLVEDHRDFSELCRQYSIDPNARQGGLIGPASCAALNPELRSKLLNLRPGEIAAPFSLDEGKTFVIAQLNSLQIAQLSSQLVNHLRSELFDQWIERQLTLGNIKIVR